MIERLLLTLLFIGAGALLYGVLRSGHVRRMNRHGRFAAAGQPTLLYFRGDGCPACPAQARYLAQLAGRVAIRTIDAEAEPETAVRYGVFTLPTTILVDAAGAVRDVNYGLTNTQKLARQLEAIA